MDPAALHALVRGFSTSLVSLTQDLDRLAHVLASESRVWRSECVTLALPLESPPVPTWRPEQLRDAEIDLKLDLFAKSDAEVEVDLACVLGVRRLMLLTDATWTPRVHTALAAHTSLHTLALRVSAHNDTLALVHALAVAAPQLASLRLDVLADAAAAAAGPEDAAAGADSFDASGETPHHHVAAWQLQHLALSLHVSRANLRLALWLMRTLPALLALDLALLYVPPAFVPALADTLRSMYPRLLHVGLSNVEMPRQVVRALMPALPSSLRSLRLHRIEVPSRSLPDIAAVLQRCTSLASLEVRDSGTVSVSGALAAALPHAPQLRRLVLRPLDMLDGTLAAALTNSGAALVLAQLTELRVVPQSMTGAMFPVDVLRVLARVCDNVAELYISHHDMVHECARTVAAVHAFPGLRRVVFPSGLVPLHAAMRLLALQPGVWQNVTSLDLRHAPVLRDASLLRLLTDATDARLPLLQHLTVSGHRARRDLAHTLVHALCRHDVLRLLSLRSFSVVGIVWPRAVLSLRFGISAIPVKETMAVLTYANVPLPSQQDQSLSAGCIPTLLETCAALILRTGMRVSPGDVPKHLDPSQLHALVTRCDQCAGWFPRARVVPCFRTCSIASTSLAVLYVEHDLCLTCFSHAVVTRTTMLR